MRNLLNNTGNKIHSGTHWNTPPGSQQNRKVQLLRLETKDWFSFRRGETVKGIEDSQEQRQRAVEV